MSSGVLGEAKAIAEFVRLGYDVFPQFSGREPFDMVVHKDGVLSRVSVKSTSRKRGKGYFVELRRTRSNRTSFKIYLFDPASVDLLVVYIEPIDKILIFPSADITSTSMLTVY